MRSCFLLSWPNDLHWNVSSILLHTNQPGKEDRKDSHHKLSALLSLIFGRSSSWCSMTNKTTASSIFLECHRSKKRQHPPCFHALMLSCSLAPMPLLCITKVSSILLRPQISREKKTEKILITSCQLCWAWYLEDHPLDAAWQIR